MDSQGRCTFNMPRSKLKTTKSKFSTDDDNKLRRLVSQYGTKSWSLIASKFRNRNSRQCRDRWNNYLSPKNNHSKWSYDEDMHLINLFSIFGKQWSKLAIFFPKRTPVNVRNRCRLLYKHLNQKIVRMNRRSSYRLFSQTKESQFYSAPRSRRSSLSRLIRVKNSSGI